MNKSSLYTVLFAVVSSLVTLSSQAALHGRLPLTPGGTDYQAAYDDALDITWLTDAGFSGTDGLDDHLAWVAGLNSANYLGFSDWRLASMSVAAGLSTGLAESIVDCETIWQPLCRDNELGYMFYHNLGGTFGQDLTGNQLVGDVTLSNIQVSYLSSTLSGITNAWMFYFSSGFQVWVPKNSNQHAWVVRSGDVLVQDADGDGIEDTVDNCTNVINAGQEDADGDGCGNICDGDLDNSGLVDFTDIALFKAAFFTVDPVADLNSSGLVDFDDLATFKNLFFQPPGPAAPGTLCY